MSAHDETLLPKPPLDLPTEPKEIPAHATHGSLDHPEEHHYREVKELLSWTAPGRPFKSRQREYFLNMLLIMLAVLVILFLFHEYMLMLVVMSLVFVNYALNTVPPHDFKYRISTEGVTVESHFFLWEELYDFYFKKQDGIDVVQIRTQAYIPGVLTLTLGPITKEQIKSVLLPYLPYREVVAPTFMEKSGDWLSRTFPLERRKAE